MNKEKLMIKITKIILKNKNFVIINQLNEQLLSRDILIKIHKKLFKYKYKKVIYIETIVYTSKQLKIQNFQLLNSYNFK